MQFLFSTRIVSKVPIIENETSAFITDAVQYMN